MAEFWTKIGRLGAWRKSEFLANERGNAFIIFALTFTPALFTVGAAIDYSRYSAARAALQQGADAASLSVLSRLTSGTAPEEVRKQAQAMIATNPRLASATVSDAGISGDRQEVCINAKIEVMNTFLNIVGVSTMAATARSCSNLSSKTLADANFEIALVLDRTGSMTAVSDGSESKIGDLQRAATTFVTTMFAKSPGKVKISVVPFSSGVNAVDPNEPGIRNASWVDVRGENSQHWIAFGGKEAANAIGFNSRFDIFDRLKQRNEALGWGGCFEEPAYPYNVNADVSVDDSETLLVPYLAPDESPADYPHVNPRSTTDFYRSNHYIDTDGRSTNPGDDSSTCPDEAVGSWNKTTHVCKYLQTSPIIYPDSYNKPLIGEYFKFGPNRSCPPATQRLLRLTTSQSAILERIKALVPNGNTNLHVGLMWGWRTLSDKAPFSDGAPYKARDTRKVIIFITDGMNTWSCCSLLTKYIYGYDSLGFLNYNGEKNRRLANGSWSAGDRIDYQSELREFEDTYDGSVPRAAMDQLTLEACANARTKGIEIFTIGVSGRWDPIDAQGLDLLRRCATNADHYFSVTDSPKVLDAFLQIANRLGNLRLSQ